MENISIGIAGLVERRPGAGIMALAARNGHTLKICRDRTAGVQASNTPLVWWGYTIILCGSGDAIKCLVYKGENKQAFNQMHQGPHLEL